MPAVSKTALYKWIQKLDEEAAKKQWAGDEPLSGEDIVRISKMSPSTFQKLRNLNLLPQSSKPCGNKRFRWAELRTALTVCIAKNKMPEIDAKKSEMEFVAEARRSATNAARSAYRDTLLAYADRAKHDDDVVSEVVLLREYARKDFTLKKLLEE